MTHPISEPTPSVPDARTIPSNVLPVAPASREQLLRIHASCTELEKRWASPIRTTIEDIVASENGGELDHLLESLIRSELELRENEPIPPSANEFHSRFPMLKNAVNRAFCSTEELMVLDEHAFSTWNGLTAGSTGPEAAQVGGFSVMPMDPHPRLLGNYELLEEHARGAMGVVYRARDVLLNRIVAVKVILAGQFALPIDIARFGNEAHAIAALDHPNIVPLFEFGEFDGHHFFSMPWIDGGNLADRIQNNPLPPLEAAEITVQIARAVHYAHGHGVIHRDLKPRNILIDGKSGIRVSDFGLAKIVSSMQASTANTELTLSGQIVGTPAYMAPEQAQGSADKLSDIYSIGAVLYALLTGRPPFQAATPLETMRQLQDTEVVEPRRLNAQIPRDLETITLKCLHKQPGSRYPSANDLADDLQRFIAGIPVVARPISYLEHLVRWTRRQPVVAALAISMFLSLAGGLASSLIFYGRERQQQQQAVKNFEIASAAVDKYLTEIASSPELKAHGLEKLRKDLLTTARDFYQQLDRQPLRNQALQVKLAEAYKNLGYISQELGDLPAAIHNYDQMRLAYESLSSESPQSIDYRSSIAMSLHQRAGIYSKLGNVASAESDLQAAIARYKEITSLSNAMNEKVVLALTTVDLAALYSNQNREQEGQVTYADANTIAIGFSSDSDELFDQKTAQNMVQVYTNLSADCERRGKLEEAATWLLKAIPVSQGMLIRSADAPDLRFDLASSTGKLALVSQKLDRPDEARNYFKQAEEILVPLTKEHPLVLRYLEGLAAHWLNYGALEYSRHAWVEAERADQEALRLYQELAQRQPDAVQHWLDVAMVDCNLGDSLYRRGKTTEAKVVLQDALSALILAKSLEPSHINVLLYSATAQNNLANVFNGEKKYVEAAEAYRFSIAAMRQLAANNPTAIDFPKKTASGLHNLSTALRRSGAAMEAEAAELEGRQILEKLLEKKPDSTEYRNLLVTSLNGLGDIYYDLRRLDDAKQAYEQARTRLLQLAETAGEPARFQTMLGYVFFNLGRIARNRNLNEEAIDWNSQAIAAQNIELSLRLGNEAADTKRVRGALNNAFRERARGLMRLGRLAEAKADCAQGMIHIVDQEADGLRALYARILARSGEQEASLQKLREIESLQPLNYIDVVDVAAAYALLLKSGVDEKYRQPLLEALSQGREMEREQFIQVRTESEFIDLQDFPGLAAALQAD